MFWWTSIAAADYLPVKASKLAGDVDAIYNFILICSIVSFILLMGGMAYFIVKYRRRTDNDKVAYISHNHTLEFLWSFIPFVLFMAMFFWGWKVYHKMRQFPDDAIQVAVTGRKWAWTIKYANGAELVNELVIPVNKATVLSMTSEDVIHSFYVPSFRVKQDVVPGKRSRLAFEPTVVGDYRIFCAEYCGTQHSQMIGMVHVLEQDAYSKWEKEQANQGSLSPAQKGEKLYKTQACFTCHSTDGSRIVGPSWKGLWGSARKFTDGSAIPVANEEYIRSSILNPLEKIVEGYAPAMPTYQGRISEEQINDIIEYMKTLK